MAYREIDRRYSATMGEYIREFVLDEDADLADVPKCATGSTAISVVEGNVYMVNASGDWAAVG